MLVVLWLAREQHVLGGLFVVRWGWLLVEGWRIFEGLGWASSASWDRSELVDRSLCPRLVSDRSFA